MGKICGCDQGKCSGRTTTMTIRSYTRLPHQSISASVMVNLFNICKSITLKRPVKKRLYSKPLHRHHMQSPLHFAERKAYIPALFSFSLVNGSFVQRSAFEFGERVH